MSITRRNFLAASTSSAIAFSTPTSIAWSRQSLVSSPHDGIDQLPWYHQAWRRAVIDMHIPDWDPEFLSKFDPKEYAKMLVRCKAQSIVCYCQSHVGLFHYPTKIGKQHSAFAGRNMMQEMIDACHENQIAVVLYCSLIFDRWAGDEHPEWRMRTWDGKMQGEGGRHNVLCVNSPYRDYVRQFTEEICQEFEFEGIRFDMTFWPWLCYCENCQKRFDEEVGGELPKTIDWQNEKWVAFQRARERWLVDFASIATDTVRRWKPRASVEHQSSTYPLNWMFGVTESLSLQNDFLQGDFYGDQLQGSFVRKLLERLTPNRPFGYETSFSVNLQDHTAMKSEALLEAKASAAIADSAAFVFIDAIDPVGTINHRAHDRMGKIFERLMPYYAELGGERMEDVAIFYSLESKLNMAGNGRPVSNPDTTDTHTQTCMQVASKLIRAHIPFGVITKKSLAALEQVKVLVLSNVHMMDNQECDAIRQWVRKGGKLIATGGSSLITKEGKRLDEFPLADVFGVELVSANWTDRVHYLAPTPRGAHLLTDFSEKYPAYHPGMCFDVRASKEARILAERVLPWPKPHPTKFSSIHSDPPWQKSEYPELVESDFGQGQVIYCASLVESMENAEGLLVGLVSRMLDKPRFKIEAPGCVEATLFRQEDRHRFLLSLVNFQKELPNLPIENVHCQVLCEERIHEAKLIGHGHSIPTVLDEAGYTNFSIARLETLAVIELLWEKNASSQ